MKWYVWLLLISWLIIAGLIYAFIFRGEVGPQEDGRTVILLKTDERTLILGEMRELLQAVEKITSAIAVGDMSAVTKAAKAVGAAEHAPPPMSVRRKLPIGFKKLGHPMHQAFDDLALEASSMGDAKVVTGKLGVILQKCNACHASFALKAE